MDRMNSYLGIDKYGNVVETIVNLNHLLKECSPPPHFDLDDYYEPPKYSLNQDYYE